MVFMPARVCSWTISMKLGRPVTTRISLRFRTSRTSSLPPPFPDACMLGPIKNFVLDIRLRTSMRRLLDPAP